MTQEQFNDLSHNERLFTVVDIGVFLDNYVTVDVRINLYSVDKFYVELVYDSELNMVVEVRSFRTGMHLDKYTNHIKVE